MSLHERDRAKVHAPETRQPEAEATDSGWDDDEAILRKHAEVAMPKPWEASWSSDGPTVRGGQGTGFPVIATDGSGRRAWLKTLVRQTDMRARKRFYHEVTAYETLAGLGVPELYDHNAHNWESQAPLYLAIELFEGGNLRDWIDTLGTVATFDQALALAEALGTVLARCHLEGYGHRDIKPLNIVLRTSGEPSTAVLIDFGISFNQAEDDELTRLDEEVGNRFLRLPEHALRGRLQVSDVTSSRGSSSGRSPESSLGSCKTKSASCRTNGRQHEPSWKQRSPDRRCADS